MSKTLGVLIDNNLDYDKKLIEKLGEYNFNTILINELEQIENIKGILRAIPAFILINIKSGELEGLGIYKMLQKIYFNENIKYYFLVGNQAYVHLLNELKIKIKYFIEGQHKVDYIAMEIYKDQIISTIQKDNIYKPILKSNLKDLSLNILMKYCEDFYFTGNLVLKRLDQIAIIQFQKGLIEKIKYQNYGLEEALDKILNWQSGSFILEARIHTIEEIKEMYKNIFTLIPEKVIAVEEIIDLYYDWISKYTAQYSLLKYLKLGYDNLLNNFSILQKLKDSIYKYIDYKENTNIFLDEEIAPSIAAWLKLTAVYLQKLNDDIKPNSFVQELSDHFFNQPIINSFIKYYENFDSQAKGFIFKLRSHSNM